MTVTFNPRLLVVVVALVLAVTGIIAWRSDNLKPITGVGSVSNQDGSNAFDSNAIVDDIADLYIIEFTNAPGKEKLDAIAELAEWMGSPVENTLPVRIHKDKVAILKKLPFIESITTYPVEHKILPATKSPGTQPSGKIHNLNVIITLVTPEDKDQVVNLINSLDGRVTSGARESDRYLQAEISANYLEKLAESPCILYVEHHQPAEFLNDRARDITGARPLAVPGFITGSGLTGGGQTIGLADSGLDTGDIKDLHPDLRNETGQKPRIVMLKSWAGIDKPVDTIGHGTHMAGTLVGSGAASDGKYAGLAPDASLYFQGVVNSKGQLSLPLNLALLYRPAYDAGVRVHVNGWGRKTNQYTSAAAQVDEFVRNNPDFLPVFGAGNFGPDNHTITAEANSKNAMVVGATANPRPALDAENQDSSATVDFSSRGPAADGRVKPELLAPGTSIISTASSALGGNLVGWNEYSTMQGTSMASAVTGGAASLLRQYLQDQQEIRYPSAALLKAALVNGARTLDESTTATGFGVLDLTQTVISLQQKAMLYDDNYTGIATGNFIDYEFTVTENGSPLKATLVWSDPAAAPGTKKTLVNDLDLLVITPRGDRYFGNHHLRDESLREQPDSINNVEQVYIPNPEPGKYTIRLYGRSVPASASLTGNEQRQDYAVVYGQPVLGLEVEQFDNSNDNILLKDGRRYKLDNVNATVVLNDNLTGVDDTHVLPGTRMYATGKNIYFITRYWRDEGLRLKKTSNGLLWESVNPEFRDGGYYSNRYAGITVNGEEYLEQELPPGFEIVASVDPVTQMIKNAQIRYNRVDGFIREYSPDDDYMQLLQDDKIYRLAEDITYLYNDRLVNTDPLEAAFGPAVAEGLERMAPGMPVELVITPTSSQVQNIAIKRNLVVGTVEGVNTADRTITVNGMTYRIVPGASVLVDNKPTELSSIRPGGLATLILVTEKGDIAGLSLYTNSITGRVDYLNTARRTVYLAEPGGQSHELQLEPETVIRRWGMAGGMDSLTEGIWARVILSPEGDKVWQVQCAETLRENGKKLAVNNEENGFINTSDGTSYYLGTLSRVSKNGFPLPVSELVPGDRLDIISLLAPPPVGRASLEINARPQGQQFPPELIASAVPFENDFWFTGSTSGARLYLHSANGFKKIDLTKDGQFAFSYLPHKDERYIYLVAVAGDTGAVTGSRVNLVGGQSRAFNDTAGHWAEADLNAIAGAGLIAGYPGNKFEPGQPVTRVEFTAMLARAFGWYSTRQNEIWFKDSREIPRWASQSVAGAVERHVLAGYPDGTFRPLEPVTRVEETVILARILAMHNLIREHGAGDCFADAAEIPVWARENVRNACAAGIIKGQDNSNFKPHDYATRAETAVTIYRLLQIVRDTRGN